MPIIFLERLPLPNLKTYTCVSVFALSACIYYATYVVRNPDWNKPKSDLDNNFHKEGNSAIKNITNDSSLDGRTFAQYTGDTFSVLTREPICVWTMINMAYCWLILVGRCVQKLVFGQLRVSEQQHLEEKFWNFVFYKFIFVFGVINVQFLEEVLLWLSWFSLLGFLNLLSQLGKDRFEYLSFSPTTPAWNHVKLLGLLGCIFALSLFMLLICIFVGFFQGLNTFAFMSAEVILLGIRTLHVILRYALYLYDMCHDNNGTANRDTTSVLEKRGPVVYYLELGFELAAYTIDFIHHLHMLLWSNIFLSMASLVICMQLRYLFHEIQRRYKKHRNYLWVLNHMEQKVSYPMASEEELRENSDNCAICWEKMESARKLPCTHLFHTMCLQSWLEQDKSCPTCRLVLNIENPSDNRPEPSEIQRNAPPVVRRPLNHFFHFDGSRYVSWLPSFSVEVSQLPRLNRVPASNSQLDAMARQVQQMFPHYTLPIIIEDLRITRSVELTVENILDGRLSAPVFRESEDIVSSSNSVPLALLQDNTQTSSSSSHNWDELNVENFESEDAIAVGSRFSKSSSEREKILYKRKERLIQAARKRFVEKERTRTDS